MNPEQYLTERVDDQIKWYNAKSRASKKAYRTLRVLGVAVALSVPILSSFLERDNADWLKIIIAVAGAAVALIEALLSLYKFRDNWTNYRNAAEALIQHKYLYSTQTSPYDGARPFVLLVQNAENIMAGERVAWIKTNTAEEEKLKIADDDRDGQPTADVAPPALVTAEPSGSGEAASDAAESAGNEMNTELEPAEQLSSSSASEEGAEANAPNSPPQAI